VDPELADYADVDLYGLAGVVAPGDNAPEVDAEDQKARGMNEPLPELLDAKALQRELGVTRAAAEKIMQALPIVQITGLRKVFVRRSDVEQLLQRCTYAKDEVPA
jgi:hypothetical protein